MAGCCVSWRRAWERRWRDGRGEVLIFEVRLDGIFLNSVGGIASKAVELLAASLLVHVM